MLITSIKEGFQEFLDREGLKFTAERRVILDNIFEAHEHFEADDLWIKLRGEGRRVSKATIYRTLTLLIQSGIIRESITPTGSSSTHYEVIWGVDDRHHNHVVCLDCGAIVPFSSDPLHLALKEICVQEVFELGDQTVKLKAHCKQFTETGVCRRSDHAGV